MSIKNQRLLGLDFAAWIWAVNNGKEAKYYEDHYGFHNVFNKETGGRIVGRFFLANPKLLHMAYSYLSVDWNTTLWTTYPGLLSANFGETKTELDFNEFSWLLFISLAFSIDKRTIYELVDGDCDKLWKQLNKDYPERKNKNE